jgi:predicted Zn-ribbon and HTH transcriptional regulator
MLKIYVSGKTLVLVRELKLNPTECVTFSNIDTNLIPNNIKITPDMLFKKVVKSVNKKTGVKTYKLAFNKEFWLAVKKEIKHFNIIIDEAHIFMNSREAMSTRNKILSNFLSISRKLVGGDRTNSITLVSQTDKRVDVNARDLATLVSYRRMFYLVTCFSCGFKYSECNDTPKIKTNCPKCKSKVNQDNQSNHIVECLEFSSMENFQAWRYFGEKSYFERSYITDVAKYFDSYSTLQWEDLLGDDLIDTLEDPLEEETDIDEESDD